MNFPRSLHWRIAIAYTALIFLTMGVVSVYLVGFVRDTFVTNLESRLENEAALVAEAVAPIIEDPSRQGELEAQALRAAGIVSAGVTIIDIDGRVLADTFDPQQNDGSHSRLSEFRDALALGRGIATRFDSAAEANLLFVAVPIPSASGEVLGVARLAVPMSSIQANINRIIFTISLSAMVVGFLSVGLGYLLARRTSRSVYLVAEGARRIADGDLEYRVRSSAADETKELAEAFNSMAATIRDTVSQLSEERNTLSAVLDTMADGIMVVESDGQVSLTNNAAEWLLGVDLEDMAGGRFAEIVRDHELQRLVERTISSRQPGQIEVEMFHLRRYLSAIATPLTHAGSRSVLLTLHDLTRIRQVETTRKEFVTNVSHELRSPLTSIKAMVETLADGALEDPKVGRDFLGRIERDVNRMNAMVNDLLELSRLESGQISLNLAPFDIRALVEDVVADCQPRVANKRLAVQSRISADVPRVIGERDKIRQVLLNLLENAFKHTGSDGRIDVSAAMKGRFVEIAVADTGSGIALEHLPHVFERFYKVDRARRDGGTGLGLAIVKHIVQTHGGTVRAESELGVGSTFYFTLPRAT